jgi:TusA-related sulfurtransferase
MDAKTTPDKIVDARGILCPGPFWELIKAYRNASNSEIISVYSSDEYDPDTRTDAPKWIDRTGNRLIGVVDHPGYYEIIMEKTKQFGPSS